MLTPVSINLQPQLIPLRTLKINQSINQSINQLCLTRRKTSRSKDENQQQTQPTYDAESGNRTRATLVGGECSAEILFGV